MLTVGLPESHAPPQNRCWLKPLCTIGEFRAAVHYRKSKVNKPMTLQACCADSGLHPTFCKAGCLQPKHDFLVYLSPNSHVDLRDSNNPLWGKQNQVSCVSKQCTSPNSCFPNKEGLASNKFRPLNLARNIWLASTQQPNLTLSLPEQMR